MGVPWLDLKPQRPGTVSPLGSVVTGRFVGEAEPGFVRVAIGSDENVVNVPHGGGVFPVGGPVSVQLDADGVPMGVLAGVDAGGETVALGATGRAIAEQAGKLDKSLGDMAARVKAAAEGPVDTGRLRAGGALIKGDLIAGGTVGARHIVASEELEAKLATFRKITTDEIVAGKAKISGDLIADTIEGKTLRGSRIEGGRMIVKNDAETYGATITTSSVHGPLIGFANIKTNGFDEVDLSGWPLMISMPGVGTNKEAEAGVHVTFRAADKNGGEASHTLTLTTDGVSRAKYGNPHWLKSNESISWDEIFAAVKRPAPTVVQEEKRGFGDLDRDWRREPREFELVKTGKIVDLFGGEWVRQNSEWNYGGNQWFEWRIIPEGMRPKQWVHFTVVITEDNFPHFAQGVIRPDGTFGLKLDKGIRVKPNVSRIMIPPVRWHL